MSEDNVILELKAWIEKQIRVQYTMGQIESGNKKRVLAHKHRKEVYTCCLNKIKELEGLEN